MKTFIFIVLGLLISIISYSQKLKGVTTPPKGMVFCPQGSYDEVKLQNGDSIKVNITISPFWISNEITNNEFREFYMHLKQTPNDTIYWIDYKKMSLESKPFTRRNIDSYINKISHSEILPDLIDYSVWDSNPDKKDYFTKSKYNNYPVLGVTYSGAMFYCIWRTNQENEKLKTQGYPPIQDYRIPLEPEWEWAATFNDKDIAEKKNELHNVKKGEKNELGVYNLCGNVSEWTASTEELDDHVAQVVRGGSWKSNPGTESREILSPDKATNYIGFRIVRSYPTSY